MEKQLQAPSSNRDKAKYYECENSCFQDTKKYPDESCLVKALSGFNPKAHECYFKFRACMKVCLIDYKNDVVSRK